jgi:uncharacterized membrane protein (DUF485 family)
MRLPPEVSTARGGTVSIAHPPPPVEEAQPAEGAGPPQEWAPEDWAPEDWATVQASPEFAELRRRLRNFVFPVAGLFLAWYALYVLMATYLAEFMSTPVLGNINIGLIMGMLQFVSTFAITAWYVRYADRRLDPLAMSLRDEMESAS